ncbi:hypothetical protein BDW22DRAFT_1346712 [Trametopsis cervina]|nr:hypothetical protein BDW22DRAFT_1346712 [Trametopsis cervina]
MNSGRKAETPRQRREEQERQRKTVEDEQAKAQKNAVEAREKEMRKAEKSQREEARKIFNQVMAENAATKLDPTATRGCFKIYAPRLSEEWPSMCRPGLTLRVSPSEKSGRHLWMSFDFGVLTGIARGSSPPTDIGGSSTFTWHGEETVAGQSLYGSENKGTVTFLGNGKIVGTIEGGFFGKAPFVGIRDEEKTRNRVWVKHVQKWKTEYRCINAEDILRGDTLADSDTTGDENDPGSASEEDDEFEGSTLSDGESYSHLWEGVAEASEGPVIPQKRKRQTARRARPFIRRSDTRQTGYETKQTVIKWLRPSLIPRNVVHATRASGQAKGTAKYDVDCPSLRDNWEEYYPGTFTLKIAPSKGKSHIWAAFDLGSITGVMRCTAPPVVAGGSCTFHWRGTEEGEGKMAWLACNKGTITFCGDGRIEGVIAGSFFRETSFSGTFNSEASRNKVWAKCVPQWKKRYRSINQSAWIAGGSIDWSTRSENEAHREGPAASDTSDDEKKA